MASSSSSSIPKTFKYDVFLSFRGEDTRKNFIDHLYYALQQKSIYAYKDDIRIEKGKRINDDLIRAIRDSKFFIIVFSKNYASSSWCLDELVEIMECQKTIDQTAYPVFYDVEPSEIRKQSGAVGDAFDKHRNKEDAQKWREALEEASVLAGWELKNTADGHEAKFIQKIVEEISQELRSISLSVDGKWVGMETRINDVVSSLETSLDDVLMIGIKGIGGGGKTTLARAVFDQISIFFEGKSFVENVREVSKVSLSSLQRQILSDVLNDRDISVNSVYDGKNMIKKRMRCRKVLVVLDDVDHIEQLEVLAGEPNWFKPGSRIIITTRDEQVLVAHRVNLIRDVNLLSNKEAICLFSKYAFGREIPIQGYEELSQQVVRYAAGLPLTIRVLGSFLCGKNELEWNDALERLKTIPLKEISEKLELSYIGLEEDYKEIFLDVACILKGWRRDEAIRMLESCGFHARNGLKVLEQKSLITISDNKCLGMHDHIEEMGKNIVRRLHPDEPNKHSRLWIAEEIKDILANDLGTKATKCIYGRTGELDIEIVMKGLGNMKKLRFLSMFCAYGAQIRSNWKPDEISRYFPDALRYLSWNGYPFSTLPKTFQANNLVSLQMHSNGLIQLWEGGERKVLNKLRFLDLSAPKLKTLDLGLATNIETVSLKGCSDLLELHMPVRFLKLKSFEVEGLKLRTLDFREALNLETLSLKQCEDLVEFHMPFECLKLIHVNLINCSKLTTLNLGLTPNLEILDLEGCYDLVEFHMPVGCPKLESLVIMGSKLRTLDLRHTLNLETLGLVDCVDLVELHMPGECLKLRFLDPNLFKLRTLDLGWALNLETLSLKQCDDLVKFHMPVECLKLIHVNLINCSKLTTLNLGLAPNLEILDLEGCYDLVEFHIPVGCLKLESLVILGSKLRTLDLRQAPNLETLSLVDCADLVELLMPGECPKLRFLDLNLFKLRTLDLGGAPNLVRVCLEECDDLVEFHMCDNYPKLKYLDLNHSKLRTFNPGLTPNLAKLVLEGCYDLEELHLSVGCLKLIYIQIIGSKLRTFDLGPSPNLMQLRLEECNDLVEIHMPGECHYLESLYITGAKLRTFDLGWTPSLKTLTLVECADLVELHMPVECPKLISLDLNLSKLRTLNLTGTPNLARLSLEGCEDLVEFHMPVECLKLIYLKISHLKLRNLHFGLAPNLKLVSLGGCYDLVELHISVVCPKIEFLDINGSNLRTLDLGMASDLKTLRLSGCYDLIELHMPLSCLKLESIDINGSNLRTLDLGPALNLKTLKLRECYDLIELHMPLGCLKLESLDIRDSKLRAVNLGRTLNLMT